MKALNITRRPSDHVRPPVSIVTIGVYGFTEPAFFAALQNTGVDTFCDIRARRGVRGHEYAFANSARLQRRLAQLGIRYFHFPELAPSSALRQLQAAADQELGIARRKRTALSPEFIRRFRQENLAGFKSDEFLAQLGPDARTVALFCVEGDPHACHRSIVAVRLHDDLGVAVRALRP